MKKLVKLILSFILVFAFSASFFQLKVFAATDKTDLTYQFGLVTDAIQQQNSSLQPYYEIASYQAFLNNINNLGGTIAIQAVIDDSNATQSTVTTLANDLSSALNGLVLDYTYYSTFEVYAAAKSRDLSNYTLTSKILYNNELDRIKSILINPTSGETVIQDLNNDIANAESILVSLPDFSELRALCNTASKYREADYSISSYSALQTSINSALSVINDTGATQEDADNAQSNLQQAIKNLSDKADVIYILQGETLDINQYVTLGDASIASYQSSSTTTLTIDSDGIVTGIDYGNAIVKITLSNGVVEQLDLKVKAGVSKTIMALSISVPFVGIAVGSTIIFTNKKTWENLYSKIIKVFKKQKKI